MQISRIVVLCNTLCFLGDDTYKKYGEEFATCYYNIEMNAFKPLSLLAPWLPTKANILVKRSRQRLIDIITEEVITKLLVMDLMLSRIMIRRTNDWQTKKSINKIWTSCSCVSTWHKRKDFRSQTMLAGSRRFSSH